jgi:hypothetical protein
MLQIAVTYSPPTSLMIMAFSRDETSTAQPSIVATHD